MNLDVISRIVYRNLRNLKAFEFNPDNPDWRQIVPLEYNERILGVYRNVASAKNGDVFVTNQKLYVVSDQGGKAMKYQEIADLETDIKEEKSSMQSMIIHLNTGNQVSLVISGVEGRSRDIFAFVQFLNRVIEIYKQ